MTRNILFRGKRIDNGAWVEGFYSKLYYEETGKEQSIITHQYFYPADMSYPYPHVSTVNSEVVEETVGQFTGIEAKKHKTNLSSKIFEGDIFRGLNGKNIEVYYVVMWIDKLASFYMIPSEHYYYVLINNNDSKPNKIDSLLDEAMLFDFSVDCYLMKVGNVHDNKELI